MNILIVEDEFITAVFIKSVIEKLATANIDIVDNASDAIELSSHTLFDIVFMDINIKGKIDGLELAAQLYKKYQPKIIFITSYQDSQTIHEASFASPVGYIIKPVIQADIESIFMIVKNTIAPAKTSEEISLGEYIYNKKTKTLLLNDTAIKLSKLESKVFYLLVKNLNNVVENEYIKNYLWEEMRSHSILRELISRLRKKVPGLNIKNHSNYGYILQNS